MYLGGALIKPTTFFTIFIFHYNWICGLAVCLFKKILRTFPCFLKQSSNKRKRFWASEVSSPANFVDLPHLPIPQRGHKNWWFTYPPVAICAMQLHGGKTCPCNCIAWFLPTVFFTVWTRAYACSWCFEKYPKIPISVTPIALIVSLGPTL